MTKSWIVQAVLFVPPLSRWQLFEKVCGLFQLRELCFFSLIYALFLVSNPTARDEKT